MKSTQKKPKKTKKLQQKVRPHGTRAKYVAENCRCARCREANTVYCREWLEKKDAAVLEQKYTPRVVVQHVVQKDGTSVTRQVNICPGVDGKGCPDETVLRADSLPLCQACRMRFASRGLVNAGPVREHILKLSEKGVGGRRVAKAAGVGYATVRKILGGQENTTEEIARKILATTEDSAEDASLVDATSTWAKINDLLENHGFSQKSIARGLGKKTARLQLRPDRVSVQNKEAVDRLYEEAVAEAAKWEARNKRNQAQRVELLQTIPPRDRTMRYVAETFAGVWPGAKEFDSTGYRKLLLDLQALKRTSSTSKA